MNMPQIDVCKCGGETIIRQNDTKLLWIATCLKCNKQTDGNCFIPQTEQDWKNKNK